MAGLTQTPRSGWLIAAGVLIADVLTKRWALNALSDGPHNLIGDFLRLRLTFNPGAAFSSFTGAGQIIAVIASVAVVGIAVSLPRLSPSDVAPYSLIMGGAAGNLWDRVVRAEDGFLSGEVVDFIDFNFWPTFNVADSAITIGVVLILSMPAFSKMTSDGKD